MRASQESGTLECAFCGKANADVGIMITGPNVQICGECVLVSYSYVMAKLLHCATPAKQIPSHKTTKQRKAR